MSTYFLNNSGTNTIPYDTAIKGATTINTLATNVALQSGDIIEAVAGGVIDESGFIGDSILPDGITIRSWIDNGKTKPSIKLSAAVGMFNWQGASSYNNIKLQFLKIYKDFTSSHSIISFASPAVGCEVYGCEIYLDGGYGNVAAISLDSAIGCTIEENAIRDCRFGLSITTIISTTSIQKNSITANGAGYGIRLWNASSGVEVKNNNIFNCSLGMEIKNMSNVNTLDYNNVWNCATPYSFTAIAGEISAAGSNSIKKNPKIISTSGTDFSMTLDSPCIGTGFEREDMGVGYNDIYVNLDNTFFTSEDIGNKNYPWDLTLFLASIPPYDIIEYVIYKLKNHVFIDERNMNAIATFYGTMKAWDKELYGPWGFYVGGLNVENFDLRGGIIFVRFDTTIIGFTDDELNSSSSGGFPYYHFTELTSIYDTTFIYAYKDLTISEGIKKFLGCSLIVGSDIIFEIDEATSEENITLFDDCVVDSPNIPLLPTSSSSGSSGPLDILLYESVFTSAQWTGSEVSLLGSNQFLWVKPTTWPSFYNAFLPDYLVYSFWSVDIVIIGSEDWEDHQTGLWGNVRLGVGAFYFEEVLYIGVTGTLQQDAIVKGLLATEIHLPVADMNIVKLIGNNSDVYVVGNNSDASDVSNIS